MKTYSIGTVGNINITIINEEGIEYIPVRSICKSLELSYSKLVVMIMEEPMLEGKWKLLDTSTETMKSDSIAIPIQWMLGYFFIIIKETNLSTKESIKTLKEFNLCLMDHVTK
jgi:hypothetical protein